MANTLLRARAFAKKIRFSGDEDAAGYVKDTRRSGSLKDVFYCNELCLTREVTPELFDGLEQVLSRLGIPQKSIEAFVYASSEINAQCYAADSAKCIIRFSSGLIDILSHDEYQFVVGHELGHFLLSHSFPNDIGDDSSAEFYMQQRAQEISADRMGLIACASLDVAIKALLKTVSGLNDKHLRFDVGGFLSQLKKTTKSVGQSHQSTHPSILVRCRALLWFSMHEAYCNETTSYHEGSLDKLDERISGDLYKYVDGPLRRVINESKEKFLMWTAVLEIINSGKFSKASQKQFKSIYGEETHQKVLALFDGLSASDLQNMVLEKLEDAKQDLAKLIPSSFDAVFKELQSK